MSATCSDCKPILKFATLHEEKYEVKLCSKHAQVDALVEALEAVFIGEWGGLWPTPTGAAQMRGTYWEQAYNVLAAVRSGKEKA